MTESVPCCRDPIDMRLAAKVLSPADFTLLEQRMEEHCAKEKMYCPGKGCSKFINLDKGSLKTLNTGRPMICPGCKRTQLSVVCKLPWHAGVSCNEYQRALGAGSAELAQVAKKMGWMPCLRCKTFVKLREEFNHVTCMCGPLTSATCVGQHGKLAHASFSRTRKRSGKWPAGSVPRNSLALG